MLHPVGSWASRPFYSGRLFLLNPYFLVQETLRRLIKVGVRKSFDVLGIRWGLC